MYVKLYNKVLDSSIADNRKLRHFFTDLLLCSDPDGNVIMTKKAIANRIRAELAEVEWGIEELMKPDTGSLTTGNDGRRIIPLEGHGYGWKILNYEMYRDFKSSKEMREATAERVRRWRQENPKGKRKPSAARQAQVQAAYEGAKDVETRIRNGEPVTLKEAKEAGASDGARGVVLGIGQPMPE